MATWADVERAALRLPRAVLDGEAISVGPHPFARRRDLDGCVALQFWCCDRDDVAAYRADPERFVRIHQFKVKASAWVWLDRLDDAELREILVESWRTRTGRRSAPGPETLR